MVKSKKENVFQRFRHWVDNLPLWIRILVLIIVIVSIIVMIIFVILVVAAVISSIIYVLGGGLVEDMLEAKGR